MTNYSNFSRPSDRNITKKVISPRLTSLPHCSLGQKPLKYVWIPNVSLSRDIARVIQFCQFMISWLCNSTFKCGLSFLVAFFCFNTFAPYVPFLSLSPAVQIDFSSVYCTLIVFSLILSSKSTSFRSHG